VADALPEPAIAAGDDSDRVFQIHGSPKFCALAMHAILRGSRAKFNRPVEAM
jgi:hypothetical protein